jgi:hypothetical protein
MTPAVEGILLQKSKIEQPYGRRDAAAGAARLAAWRSKNEVDDCVAYRRQAWLEVHCFFFPPRLCETTMLEEGVRSLSALTNH